jgi:hypothetical protein
MTPPAVTLTPARVLGGVAAFVADAELFARPVPKIEMILPGANDVLGVRDAAFRTCID